eukprot:3682768-Pleurochrysis_carterae.AAC.1
MSTTFSLVTIPSRGASPRWSRSFSTSTTQSDVISPGWLLSADEGMASFEGGEMRKSAHPKESMITVKAFLPRKLKKLGGESKMLGECNAGIIIQIETQVGAKYHGELEFTDEFGQLAAMPMRLTKPWHHTKRAYAADSWFIGFDTWEALLTNS